MSTATLEERDVLSALGGVVDPDLNRDLVSAGFVKGIHIEGGAVRLDLELTTPACPLKDFLRNLCVEALKKAGAERVAVRFDARVRAAPVHGRRRIAGVKNVIAVASGKGGVGKSTVCINLALALSQAGARVGVLDCDFHGPSLPAMVGLYERARADREQRIEPHRVYGLQLLSMGFVVDRYEPVTMRGPMLHKILQQFLFHARWDELDYLLLDLPPGTGDVQLSLGQIAPVSAAVLVTTPQETALRDVEKGLEMFIQSKTPVLGVIENMSFFRCGSCDKKHRPFPGRGGAFRLAQEYDLPLLGELPLAVETPSPLGRGEPLLARAPESDAAATFREAAGRIAAGLSRLSDAWAVSGPDAMEV